MVHGIPVGFPQDGSQYHMTGTGHKVNGSRWVGNHKNNRSVFVYKFAVLI